MRECQNITTIVGGQSPAKQSGPVPCRMIQSTGSTANANGTQLPRCASNRPNKTQKSTHTHTQNCSISFNAHRRCEVVLLVGDASPSAVWVEPLHNDRGKLRTLSYTSFPECGSFHALLNPITKPITDVAGRVVGDIAGSIERNCLCFRQRKNHMLLNVPGKPTDNGRAFRLRWVSQFPKRVKGAIHRGR